MAVLLELLAALREAHLRGVELGAQGADLGAEGTAPFRPLGAGGVALGLGVEERGAQGRRFGARGVALAHGLLAGRVHLGEALTAGLAQAVRQGPGLVPLAPRLHQVCAQGLQISLQLRALVLQLLP